MNGQRKSRKKKPAADSKPVWDARSGKLTLNGVLLARFARRAVNLWPVLYALQEQGWPEYSDNPIPPARDRANERQLHDAIKSLNARLGRWLRFHGNRGGSGLWWELVRSPKPARPKGRVLARR